MFKEIRALTGEFQTSLYVINYSNRNTLTESKDILERWREYCEEMYEGRIRNSEHTPKIIEREPELLLKVV